MKRKQVDEVLQSFRLWRTAAGETYVDFVDKDKAQTVSTRSKAFEGIVTQKLYEADIVPKAENVRAVMAVAEHMARRSDVVNEANLRVAAGAAGTCFYDVGDDEWTTIHFGSGRWAIQKGAPVKFVRGQHTLTQTLPKTSSGSGRDLRTLLGRMIRADERTLRLLEAWLIGALKPGGPYPVLIINGEQGSAKSTTSRLLRRIIDPHGLDLREPPREARDLAAGVKNSYVLAYDNVSRVPAWFSDSLCRIATGTGSVGGRALYTDTDEVAFVACRPIILNGIPDFVEREDLSDRSITVHLPAISPEQRRDDDTYWAEVGALMPELLGALYDRVAQAVTNFDNTVLESSPRMSNFAKWVVAGLPPDDARAFLDVLRQDRIEAMEQTLEHNSLAQALIEFIAERDRYVGTIHDLLGALRRFAPRDTTFWPDTSLKLSNSLKRLQPILRAAGIEVARAGREAGTGRTKLAVNRLPDMNSRPFAVSVAPAMH